MFKQIISAACLMLITTVLSHAQNLQYEYWLDDNYADKVTQEATTEDISLAIDVSELTPGIHSLTFRVGNVEGEISYPYRYIVYLPDETPVSQQELSKYEYWFDDNYSDAVTQDISSEEIALTIDVSSLTTGIHALTFRVSNEDGTVSAPKRYFVYLPDETSVAQTELRQYEYWIDSDYANHVVKEISGDEALSTIDVDVKSLATGLHLLFLRAQNADGNWGSPMQYAFYIPDEPTESDYKVAYYEYWFDSDYANCKRIEVNDDEYEGMIQVDIPDLQPGIHFYHLRAFNTAGMAGVPSTYLVNVPEEPEPEASPLVGFRYAFNNLAFEEEMDPSDEFEMADFEFDMPDILDVATFDEDRCTYTFSETAAKLERTTDVNFTISFVNEQGVWSNPAAFTYQEDDVVEHEFIDLVQNEILELEKIQHGDFYALQFSITKTGTSYFAADQDCTMEIFKASTGTRSRIFTSEELHAVKSIGLSKGTYYAIVHSMPEDKDNPSETVRLLFSDKKQQLIYCLHDVNMDGKFDSADIDCLVEYITGQLPEKINLKAADANEDGEITIADITTLIDLL